MTDHQEALEKRNKLISSFMLQYGLSSDPAVLPIVSLDNFFDGNWDDYSFAPNRFGSGRPPLSECYQILVGIRDRADVQDVLVAIDESPDSDDPEDLDLWLTSNTVYVLASFTQDDFIHLTKQLVPDEAHLGTWSRGTGVKPQLAPELQPGYHVYVLWWD